MSKFDIKVIKNVVIKGDAKYNDRYSLEIETNNTTDNTAIVILKNPASTAKANIFYGVAWQQLCDVDKTTSHILNILGGSYKKIITFNLFPYFDNIPTTINSIYNIKTLNTNNSYIANMKEMDRVLNNNSNADIYCAWGQPSGINKKLYDKAIDDIMVKLQAGGNQFSLFEKDISANAFKPYNYSNQNKYPLHGLMW